MGPYSRFVRWVSFLPYFKLFGWNVFGFLLSADSNSSVDGGILVTSHRTQILSFRSGRGCLDGRSLALACIPEVVDHKPGPIWPMLLHGVLAFK